MLEEHRTETSHASSPHSGMLNRKLGEIFFLVYTLSNSNIAITICHCNFESALVWKHSIVSGAYTMGHTPTNNR